MLSPSDQTAPIQTYEADTINKVSTIDKTLVKIKAKYKISGTGSTAVAEVSISDSITDKISIATMIIIIATITKNIGDKY